MQRYWRGGNERGSGREFYFRNPCAFNERVSQPAVELLRRVPEIPTF